MKTTNEQDSKNEQLERPLKCFSGQITFPENVPWFYPTGFHYRAFMTDIHVCLENPFLKG